MYNVFTVYMLYKCGLIVRALLQMSILMQVEWEEVKAWSLVIKIRFNAK